MRVSLLSAAVGSTLLAHAVATRTAPTPTAALIIWFENAALSFFPNHTNWRAGYDASFAPSLKATFKQGSYDFAILKTLYTGLNAQITADYSEFTVTFTELTAFHDAADIGRIVTVTDLEKAYGRKPGSPQSVTDAAFAVISVVSGTHRITEWREISNFSPAAPV
ncbi:hypothetical protein MMC25_006219 [Agyrium rufum]|nr:hypothetical protein [Agyrium rufum]